MVSSVDFASFGSASGTCREYAYGACHATNTSTRFSQYCMGRQSCDLLSSASLFSRYDPCPGEAKTLTVQARCTEAAQPMTLSTKATLSALGFLGRFPSRVLFVGGACVCGRVREDGGGEGG